MIELTTSAIILLSMFYGTGSAEAEPIKSSPAVTITVADQNIVDNIALIATPGTSKTVEVSVREYFKDTPILAEISRCESAFRHIGTNGEIIRGKVNRGDIGVMQINTYYHEEQANKLGIDLMTLRGNLEYAKQLYDKEGTAPWQSSSKCWNKYVTISKK